MALGCACGSPSGKRLSAPVVLAERGPVQPGSSGRRGPALDETPNVAAAEAPMLSRTKAWSLLAGRTLMRARKPRPEPMSSLEMIHALGKTVRVRDRDHRRYVLRQACLVCGRVPSDPHHLTFTQPRALGRRVSDQFTVPLCRVHHRELHRSGNELAWWGRLNIDPLPVALRLWQHTGPTVDSAPQGKV